MNETAIAWTNLTWNGFSGCEKVSEECKYCYAEQLSEQKRGTKAFPNGFELTIRPHKFSEPLKVKTPSLVFVNSMSDFFWSKVSDEIRDAMVDVMEACPQHEFQVLTKRPDEMLRYSRRRKLPPNFWAGVSVGNRRNWGRLDILRQVEAEIRFISAEPLIGDLDGIDLGGIHWLITGGESGLHLRDPHVLETRGLVERGQDGRWRPREARVPWVRSIRDACQKSGTAFFHKQWGGPRPESGGRELDGRTWDQFPRMPKGGKVNAKIAQGSLPIVM